MTPSCRNCDHAYLRTEQTKHYSYEACALGIAPMAPYLIGSCSLWDAMTPEKAKEFTVGKPKILWGEPLEL